MRSAVYMNAGLVGIEMVSTRRRFSASADILCALYSALGELSGPCLQFQRNDSTQYVETVSAGWRKHHPQAWKALKSF